MPTYHISQLNARIKGIDPSVVRAALDLLPARIADELRPGGSAETNRVEIAADAGAALLAGRMAQQIGQQVRARIATGEP